LHMIAVNANTSAIALNFIFISFYFDYYWKQS